ncbi:hypothetical protein GQ600_15075 [Phytophthora cactorum]|nr:hypothetical protein GQ600_15075 [Phytophthora cactorum]
MSPAQVSLPNPDNARRASGQGDAEALATLKRTLLVAALETPYAHQKLLCRSHLTTSRKSWSVFLCFTADFAMYVIAICVLPVGLTYLLMLSLVAHY